MKSIIHVNRQNIAMNAKDDGNRPVFTIKQGSKPAIYARRVEVLGPSTLVSEEGQLSCGARAWIETEAELRLDGAMSFKESQDGSMISATIIADASFCPEQKVAGWAVWIAGDTWKSQGFSGPITQLCTSSNEAEVIAAAVGCGIAYRSFAATRLLIQSDCATVKYKLANYLPEDVQENCRVCFRHVKGHTKIDKPRYWGNRWCDTQAKGQMRALRS